MSHPNATLLKMITDTIHQYFNERGQIDGNFLAIKKSDFLEITAACFAVFSGFYESMSPDNQKELAPVLLHLLRQVKDHVKEKNNDL